MLVQERSSCLSFEHVQARWSRGLWPPRARAQDRMKNTRHFEELIPLALRSVPYIYQSHLCKGYVALENLYAQRPHWPDSVWNHCVQILRNDEPKVDGLIAEELLGLDSFVDRTSGRDFGPDWILSHGLIPLSYWAMRKKYEELGDETGCPGHT